MIASVVEYTAVLLTVLTPLVAVPLAVITFYLKSLREHQVSRHRDLVRRVESLEASMVDVRKAQSEFEREFTSKEEWVRECMYSRRTLEQLTEATIRIETSMRNALPRTIPVNNSDHGIRDCASSEQAVGRRMDERKERAK